MTILCNGNDANQLETYNCRNTLQKEFRNFLNVRHILNIQPINHTTEFSVRGINILDQTINICQLKELVITIYTGCIYNSLKLETH